METRLGRCFFIVFSEWICLFTLTSILGGSKADVRCIPSCQLPLITASPRELAELDFAHSGESPAEDFAAGLTEGSPGAKAAAAADGRERRRAAELTASAESSSKVESRFEGISASCPEKDASDGGRKLSHSEVSSGARAPSLGDASPKSGTSDSFHGENGATGDEDAGSAAWRRARRSAETWSGLRPEGGEDASFSDPEELQLTSSTFALAGDTAHNQAMVHWSGQNSSVSSGRAPDLRMNLF